MSVRKLIPIPIPLRVPQVLLRNFVRQVLHHF